MDININIYKDEYSKIEIEIIPSEGEYDDYDKFDAWENIAGIKTLSELQEILSNAKYNTNSSILSYQFPVSRIETEYYKVYHKNNASRKVSRLAKAVAAMA